MKSKKLTSCSSAQDLNADEMKQVSESANQKCNKNDDSKSGTGTTGPGVTLDPEKEREIQAKACEGKKQYDKCSWTAGTATHTGVCNYSPQDKKYYCSYVSPDGIGSGTGGLSARQAACLNKEHGDYCRFFLDDHTVRSGRCAYDNTHLSAYPMICTGSYGTKEENPNIKTT